MAHCPNPHSFQVYGMAFGSNVNHISASSRRSARNGHLVTSIVGFSALSFRTYIVAQPDMGISDKVHHPDDSCVGPADDRMLLVVRTGSGTVVVASRMAAAAPTWSVRSCREVRERLLLDKSHMDLCGTAPDKSDFHTSKVVHRLGCRYVRLLLDLGPGRRSQVARVSSW